MAALIFAFGLAIPVCVGGIMGFISGSANASFDNKELTILMYGSYTTAIIVGSKTYDKNKKYSQGDLLTPALDMSSFLIPITGLITHSLIFIPIKILKICSRNNKI